jgi:hypothetical protein
MATSTCAEADALENHSGTLPLATDHTLDLGTMTDMKLDLLHVGSQFT